MKLTPVGKGFNDRMTEIKVECYSGYRADQRPLRFSLGGQVFQVDGIEDQWFSPTAIYFRVLASDGNIYVIRHDETNDCWTLEAFRSGKQQPVAFQDKDITDYTD